MKHASKTASYEVARPLVNGQRFSEAATLVQAARRAVMLWAQETCANADNMDREAPNVQKALSMAAQLEKIYAELGWMARAQGNDGTEAPSDR